MVSWKANIFATYKNTSWWRAKIAPTSLLQFFLATCYFQKGGHKNPICHIVVIVTSLLTVTENFFVIGFSWCQSDIVNPFSPFCWSEN